ncbi:MAG: hypothetical protein HY939_07480, partial [Gammaproteobacteria bacterium]|nr:hypothetical protein [Gammaproteobacteria bacterium]
MPSPSPEFNSRKRPLDASESTAKKRESDLNQPEDLSLLFLRWQDYFVMMGDQAHFMEVTTSEQGLAEIRTIADSLNELTLLGYDKELILQLLFFNQVLSPLPTEFRQVHHDLVSQGLNHAQIACRFASYPTMPERMAHLTQLKYLLVFFPDKMKNIIINYYTYFISKFNCGSMIALLDTHLGRKKIIEYDLFLKELESISYPVNLIKSLFVLNYRERSPFEVLTYIHQNLKKQKFNRTQVVAFLEWYCSEEESIEQLLMLFQLLPKLGLVLTPDQIINQLREGKWEKKFRNIVRYCSIFREHGFFVANIKALLCLKKGVIKDFIHLLPYLKLKLKRETLMSWVLSVDAKEKMRHLAAFLMTLRQFKYTNECIAKLLVLEHECGDVFGEFVRSYAALEKQGFSQGYVTACFVHCWSMPEGLQRFQKFIEQVPILLHFRSPQEIVQKLEKEDRELTGFKNLIDC